MIITGIMLGRGMKPINTTIIYRECKTVIESHLYKPKKKPGIRQDLKICERDIDASLHLCPQH
jgi:hypothetical protein